MKILLLISVLSASPPETNNEVSVQRLPYAAINLTLGFLTSVFIHESGHYGAILLYDDSKPLEFKPYPTINSDGYHQGHVSLEYENETTGLMTSMTGIASTRISSTVFRKLADADFTGKYVDGFLAGSYLATRTDGFFYIWKCAIETWMGYNTSLSQDPHRLVSSISLNKRKQMYIYAGLATLMTIDILLDWDEIVKNLKRIWD